jgi:ABC-type multidrug transport system ATPase subunit
MGDVSISLRGAEVERGGRVVLGPLDLDLPTGQVIGVIGPSGSGKSTLMRSLVGVQERVTGTVEVLGAPVGVAAREGRVGYVTQSPSVYDDLTVRENLAYIARLLAVDDGRVDEVIETVRLTSVADRRVADVSGGQQARASLSIALLNSPALLVLDEPTVGLDPVLRRQLWGEFHHLADAGCTLLVSSHVMDEAERCDWLVLLRDGRVLASGSPADLLARTGARTVEAAFLILVDGEDVRSLDDDRSDDGGCTT